jgi:hypothetical protein
VEGETRCLDDTEAASSKRKKKERSFGKVGRALGDQLPEENNSSFGKI